MKALLFVTLLLSASLATAGKFPEPKGKPSPEGEPVAQLQPEVRIPVWVLIPQTDDTLEEIKSVAELAEEYTEFANIPAYYTVKTGDFYAQDLKDNPKKYGFLDEDVKKLALEGQTYSLPAYVVDYEAGLIVTQAEEAINAIGEGGNWEVISDNTVNENFNENAQTCYVGSANKAVSILWSLTGSMYSEQMTLWGWKSGDTTYIEADSFEDESANTYLTEISEAWANFDGTGGALLVTFAQGDGGDDLNESTIYPCK